MLLNNTAENSHRENTNHHDEMDRMKDNLCKIRHPEYMPSAQFESSPSHHRAHAKPLLSTRPSRSTGSMAINPDLLFILSRL